MVNNSKILYLWDLADTLFGEEWDAKQTGLANYGAYLESLGYDLKTIDAKTYEWNYEQPFKKELLKLSLLPGFTETLTWTKNNAIFTTGNREQIDWRAEVFLRKRFPDVRPFFQTIYSTFDYGNTNHKTKEMYLDIIKKEMANGNLTLVYADNNIKNCQQFLSATGEFKKINYRLYHVKVDSRKTANFSPYFFEVPDLLSLLENEKVVFKTTTKSSTISL